MKATAFVGIAGALLVSSAATAQFSGVVVEDITNDDTAAMDLQTWTVSPAFDNPDNTLLNVFNADVQAEGDGGFYHSTAFGGGLSAQARPFDLDPANVDEPYDSFITINVGTGGDSDLLGDLSLDGDFSSSSFLNEGHIVGGWFNSNPPNLMGQAGDDGLVQIAQLTIDAGTEAGGDISFFYNEGPGTDGVEGSASFVIPTPGALALLGMAGLVGSRRRRA